VFIASDGAKYPTRMVFPLSEMCDARSNNIDCGNAFSVKCILLEDFAGILPNIHTF
jgi:hypothetical protein